ncbi:MAG: beta-galactosidase [Angelakisella sp.]
MKNYGPISDKISHMLHGGDYNPDQWLSFEGIVGEDVRLMKLSHCNVMAVNIFGWVACEPREGEFTFGWLDEIMDTLYQNGVYTILATPSGARPAWLSQKYPEVLRVNEFGVRNYHGSRHNHCYTSPVYREKVRIMNTQLALRYREHPGLLAWHISNEYGGNCYCPLCQEEFRSFLKRRYGTLDALNLAWWTGFWSHTYTDWSQVEAPSKRGEDGVHGQTLDWHRFRSERTLDFYQHEIEPLRKYTPNTPITTNFDQFGSVEEGADYWQFAPYVDVVSWDNYPYWHGERPTHVEAGMRAFIHDINRSLKHGKPFMMMESSPSATNWQPVAKLRRPGMQELASLQAIAHGSDTVQYFQWRKGLGSSEKFHGAVVDHYPTENTRVFREVTSVGEVLSKLDRVVGTSVQPEVAILYDWENNWAIADTQGPRKEKKDYYLTVQSHYQSFWNMGIPCDVMNEDCDFSNYKLVVAPMLYLMRPGVGERLTEFVQNGGTLVTTYWSGIVNESDLCFTTGRPGPLRKVMGIWSEELDALYDQDKNSVCTNGSLPDMKKSYTAQIFCDLIHAEGAQVLATYGEDFYAGMPALTKNSFGKGSAYYIAFRSYDSFLDDFYETLAKEMGLTRCVEADLPRGVTAQTRYDDQNRFIFLQNYNGTQQQLDLGKAVYTDILTGKTVQGTVTLPPYGYYIMEPVK